MANVRASNRRVIVRRCYVREICICGLVSGTPLRVELRSMEIQNLINRLNHMFPAKTNTGTVFLGYKNCDEHGLSLEKVRLRMMHDLFTVCEG